MQEERSWRIWPVGRGRFGAAGPLPDRLSYRTLHSVGIVATYVTAFGIPIAIAAGNRIVWMLWVVCAAVSACSMIALTVIRLRLDRATASSTRASGT